MFCFQMRRFLVLLLIFCGSAALVDNAHADKVRQELGTQTRHDLIFARRGKRALHLHLIRPAVLPARRLPVLIWVHGGLWRDGDARKIPPLLFEIARRGYAVASVEFRSSEEAVFPAQLDDLRAATRFLRARASEFSLDGAKVGAAGISTGAHLASLLALSGGAQCAVNICGPSDLTSLNRGSRLAWDENEGPLWTLLGGSTSEKPALARNASPLHRVAKNPPPFLILHGQDDSLVPLAQSEALFNKLRAAGGAVTYRIYRGEEHGLRGAKTEIQAEVLAFLGHWLPK